MARDPGEDLKEWMRRELRDWLARRPRVVAKHVLYRIGTGPYSDTGRTRHYVQSEPAPKPSSLAIMRYELDAADGGGYSEYYLQYLDECGTHITNTCHDTLDRAFEQARWEFEIPRTAWTFVDERTAVTDFRDDQ
jgi:hypothetical protein